MWIFKEKFSVWKTSAQKGRYNFHQVFNCSTCYIHCIRLCVCFIFLRKIIKEGFQLKLNCTATGQVLYLIDTDPPYFNWMVDEDFGKTFNFNQYVSYTLRTGRLYTYSQVECDFQKMPMRAASPYCYLDIKLRPDPDLPMAWVDQK